MYCEKCGTQINENSKFCSSCGNHLTKPQNSVKKQNVKVKSNPFLYKSSRRLFLSIIFAIIGIIPLLNFIFLPFAVILVLIDFVTNKNENTKTKIASAVVIMISICFSLFWLLPTMDSSTGNQNSQTICSHSFTLNETEATCIRGGYSTYQCSLCGETQKKYESELGHDWLNNSCKRCGKTKILELDPMNNDILAIEQIDWEINSVGGVELSITCTNHTNKQIAYVYFTINFYDRMGNPAYCSIRDEYIRTLKMTGPFDAGEKDTFYSDPIIYNNATGAIKPTKIEIEFTDGTKQTIICTGRYWSSNSYYGGDLND